jgi:hypothetical protein
MTDSSPTTREGFWGYDVERMRNAVLLLTNSPILHDNELSGSMEGEAWSEPRFSLRPTVLQRNAYRLAATALPETNAEGDTEAV